MVSKAAIVMLAGVFFLPGGGYDRHVPGNPYAPSHTVSQSGGTAESTEMADSGGIGENRRGGKGEEKGEDQGQAEEQKKAATPKSSKRKTTSPGSFVPSEKIEADQAVDFPYDI